LHVLVEILSLPTVIFEGLNRDDYEGGYCYSGRASKKMISATIEAPPPPAMVAAVYVAPVHGNNIILDWEWRREDLDHPGWPESWQRSFGETKWSRI
jgi:hypothetical protein